MNYSSTMDFVLIIVRHGHKEIINLRLEVQKGRTHSTCCEQRVKCNSNEVYSRINWTVLPPREV